MIRVLGQTAAAICAGALLLLPCASPALAAGPATETILHSFSGPEGAHPLGGVIIAADAAQYTSDPRLLGTAFSGGGGLGTIFSIQHGIFTDLHDFVPSEGKFPWAGVTQGPDGTLYGTLSNGGDRSQSRDGYGSVYAMSPAGQVRVVHQFHGPEGGVPQAPVTLDGAGDLLGTAKYGGRIGYAGTLYKITPDGTATALVDFSKGGCIEPIAPVTFDAAGNIAGTAWMDKQQPFGCVWTYSPGGTFTELHAFDNSKQTGREPRGGVTPAADGSLYGTNYYTGNFDPGTLYQIAADGTETVLHRFKCATDGGYPFGSLVSDGHGLLFGTASGCGAGGSGVVFSYDTVKKIFTTIYAFGQDKQNDGFLPIGPLSIDAQGNLYGTTEYGGDDNLGIVFKITRYGGSIGQGGGRRWRCRPAHGWRRTLSPPRNRPTCPWRAQAGHGQRAARPAPGRTGWGRGPPAGCTSGRAARHRSAPGRQR